MKPRLSEDERFAIAQQIKSEQVTERLALFFRARAATRDQEERILPVYLAGLMDFDLPYILDALEKMHLQQTNGKKNIPPLADIIALIRRMEQRDMDAAKQKAFEVIGKSEVSERWWRMYDYSRQKRLPYKEMCKMLMAAARPLLAEPKEGGQFGWEEDTDTKKT